MMFIVYNGAVECPACGFELSKIGEQDKRVHYMHHPESPICPCSNLDFRVDRMNGNAEERVRA